MSVRDLQRRFGSLLFDEASPDSLASEVVSDARASAEERIAIYAHMYSARLIEVLAEIYPLTQKLVGEDELASIAARYVRAHPSRTPSLRGYGAAMSQFLANPRSDLSVPPEAASLAALEWARYDVFDAVDQVTLTRERMAALGEAVASAPLRRIAASVLVPVTHAIDATFRALDDAEAAPVAAAEPSTMLVWRESPLVFHRRVAPDEAALLALLGEGTTLGLLCEAMAERHPPDAVDAAAAEAFSLVGRWIADGVLADF
jgi:hypothetical protein